MKRILLLITVIALVSCSYIPSKWDGNEAKKIIDIEMSAKYFNCADVKNQINELSKQVEWFDLYSKSRGSNDIVALFEELNKTVTEFKTRSDKGPVSPLYCDLKRKIIVQQSAIVAKAVQMRF